MSNWLSLASNEAISETRAEEEEEDIKATVEVTAPMGTNKVPTIIPQQWLAQGWVEPEEIHLLTRKHLQRCIRVCFK